MAPQISKIYTHRKLNVSAKVIDIQREKNTSHVYALMEFKPDEFSSAATGNNTGLWRVDDFEDHWSLAKS